MKLAEISKTVAALIPTVVGAAGEAVTLGLVHGSAAKWVAIGIGAATAVGATIAVYNAPANAPPTSEEAVTPP
jgi:hypothetical protein